MSRTSREDPLDKFRFKVSAQGHTVANDSTGKTVKTGPRDIALDNTTFVAGFHDFQMPKRTTAKGTYREGNNPTVSQIFAGLSTMEDVVLSKGIYAPKTVTPAGDSAKFSNDLYVWAQAVHTSQSTDAVFNTGLTVSNSSSSEYKKDITIVMYSRDNVPARAWILYNCFPTHFVPGSDLNASEDGEKSMESLTLAYEDFEEITAFTNL
jgi:phage tail-like protein